MSKMGGWVTKALLGLSIVLVFLSMAVIAMGDITIPQTWRTATEQSSPGDWIREDQISVYEDKVVLTIPDPFWAKFTDTNSMDPFIDETSHAIEISPQDDSTINVGDVISYRKGNSVVIHRVVERGKDAQGTYYIVKGDNNAAPDSEKVRFNDVKGVVVAVIY